MNRVLQEIFRMGVEGSLVLLIVWLAGSLLRCCKAPARPVALLWLAACFRLLSPFSFQLNLSAPKAAAAAAGPGITELEWEVLYEGAAQTAAPSQLIPNVLAAVYITGVLVLAARAIQRYYRLKNSLALAYRTEDGYYTGSGVQTPLILGVLRPHIYLPASLTGQDREMVLAHERAHLRWKDHWTRLLFYGAVCLHWYNPLVWAAYFRFVRDTETACDEEVLRAQAEKGAYSRCLLSLAQETGIPAGVLAFGRYPLKGRVSYILKWKKPGKLLTALALAVVLTVGAVSTFSFAEEAPAPQSQNADSQVSSQAVPDAGQEAAAQEWLWPVPEYTAVSRDMGGTQEDDPDNQQVVGSMHKGVDLAAPKGSRVLAMADGVVEKAGYDALGSGSGYGYLVLLRHENGWRTLYAHCDEVCVQEGDTVQQGDLIARAGDTGNSTGDHCHVEILDENGDRYSLCQLAEEP